MNYPCHICLDCDNHNETSEKEFTWHVRPRAKELARGDLPYQTTIYIVICDKCAKKCEELNIKDVYGWDRWDTLDNLGEALEE
tara:strand:- start:150 stop:398 length:249 start_codon:yes stop_codon:yes gene_type:complete